MSGLTLIPATRRRSLLRAMEYAFAAGDEVPEGWSRLRAGKLRSHGRRRALWSRQARNEFKCAPNSRASDRSRENACRLSIDTIGKHKLWVEPDCDRPRYDDLLRDCTCATHSHGKEGLRAERHDTLLSMRVRDPEGHALLRPLRGRFRRNDETALRLLPGAFCGQGCPAAGCPVLTDRRSNDEETHGDSLPQLRHLHQAFTRTSACGFASRALCNDCVDKGYSLELYTYDPVASPNRKWHVGVNFGGQWVKGRGEK